MMRLKSCKCFVTPLEAKTKTFFYYSIIRFIHFIANKQIDGITEIKITSPVRGHSYLECDKNVGLWNFKEKMETPKDFVTMIQNVRKKPFPFEVESVYKDLVYD